MAGRYENHLPHNWIKLIRCKGGTLEEVYMNKKTGMSFSSKEEYQHFIRGIIKAGPCFTDLRKLYDTISLFHAIEPKQLKKRRPDGSSTSGFKTA